jgi:transcriptional regulator
MKSRDDHIDRLLVALDDLEDAARGNIERTREVLERAMHLRERLHAGDDLVELVESEQEPRIVELLTTNMAALETTGAAFRAAEAMALRAEGLTIEAIARLFGVTRQRISALLRQRAAEPD